MKTHYALVDRANESNPHDEWGDTFCGLEYTESPLTNRKDEVTCKKCLKAIPKFLEQYNQYAKTEFDCHDLLKKNE